MKPCSGALLCGGESSRMGRDKAFLEIHGTPLWKIQLGKLRTVCGDVLICGNPAQAAFMTTPEARFEPDATPSLGPLSGLARALARTRTTRVLVLAIDMPKMTEEYLARLLSLGSDTCGVVPESGGVFEGLCAVYPACLLPTVEALLSGPVRSLQTLIRTGISSHRLISHSISSEDRPLFENWNAPEDLPQPGL